MKTKMLPGVLLLGCVALLGLPLSSVAQPKPPLIVLITGPDYNPVQNVYRFGVSVSNPAQVFRVIVVVEEAEGGKEITKFEIDMGGWPSRQFEVEGANLKPERKYVLKLQAADLRGDLIQRTDDHTSLSPSERYILASKEFLHEPPAAPEFAFQIESVNALYDVGKLVLVLDVPDAMPVLKYSGFVVDDSGQKVGDIEEDLYRGKTLEVPLPKAIQDAREPHEYKVTLDLTTKDDQRARAVYESLKLTPPPQPGLFKRIGDALTNNPLITLAIVVVISGVVTWRILAGRKDRQDLPPLYRPPVDTTGPVRFVSARARLRVRVVQSPGPTRGVEKVVTSFPYVIGRDEDCGLRILEDAQISRRHAKITLQSGQFFLTDLESTNGTFIGEMRLRANTPARIAGITSVRLGMQTSLELDSGD